MKDYNNKQTVMFSAIVLLGIASSMRAEVIIGEHDWDPPPASWTNLYGWTQLSTPASGGNPTNSGWLSIRFPPTSNPEGGQDQWYDIAYTPATNLFSGTWTTQMWIRFDFWASNTTPDQLQVRWQSATNTTMWGYNISGVSTGWNVNLNAPLTDWSAWVIEPFVDEDQYLADLASIDWIGLYLWRDGANEEIYGIDNFRLMIPEPAECLMLAAAFLASTISLRKKRRERAAPVG